MPCPAPLIAVIGGSKATPEEAAAAEAVGRVLAEGGAALVCGGRGGVMEAACRGAKAAGGLTIGILPGADRSEANPYVDVSIVTGIGLARNAIVARTAQAVIAVGGSYGTLSEIAYALMFGVPVVGLGTWEIKRDGHPPRAHRLRRYARRGSRPCTGAGAPWGIASQAVEPNLPALPPASAPGAGGTARSAPGTAPN